MSGSMFRRFGVFVALMAVGVALSGCVVVPARPYYGHAYYYR